MICSAASSLKPLDDQSVQVLLYVLDYNACAMLLHAFALRL